MSGPSQQTRWTARLDELAVELQPEGSPPPAIQSIESKTPRHKGKTPQTPSKKRKTTSTTPRRGSLTPKTPKKDVPAEQREIVEVDEVEVGILQLSAMSLAKKGGGILEPKAKRESKIQLNHQISLQHMGTISDLKDTTVPGKTFFKWVCRYCETDYDGSQNDETACRHHAGKVVSYNQLDQSAVAKHAIHGVRVKKNETPLINRLKSQTTQTTRVELRLRWSCCHRVVQSKSIPPARRRLTGCVVTKHKPQLTQSLRRTFGRGREVTEQTGEFGHRRSHSAPPVRTKLR